MRKNVWNSREVRYADSLKYEDFFDHWENGLFSWGSKPFSTTEGPTWSCSNLLTRDNGSHLYVAQVDLEPGGGHDYHAHVCVEFAYMIAGEAQFVYRSTEDRDVCEVLKAGDAAYFPSGTPHSAWNISGKPCKLLVIKLEPPYSFEELPLPAALKRLKLFDHRAVAQNSTGRYPRRKSLKSLSDRADR